MRLPLVAAALALSIGSAGADPVPTSAGPVEITAMATDLTEPWALGFLPDGGFLITLRDGAMRRYDADGGFVELAGLPPVAAQGQGGLLDVLVPRDFADSAEIFLSFAHPQGRGSGTALARARLEGDRLEDVQVIWELAPGTTGGRHFGSRIVEGRDGYLYLTVGDRGDRPSAQDPGIATGSVIRIARDGSVPADNPFLDTPGARPEIWSFGHRNPQGAALDGDGQLWVVEHGARGGDEVNRIVPGANYGWPVIAYGRHYSGLRIGEGTHREGMEQPAHFWDPSIAPSGMAFYDGALFPDWQGDLLVGALAHDSIVRLDPDQGMAEVERISSPETGRVRDVRIGPEGAIWFLSVHGGTAWRMVPVSQQ